MLLESLADTDLTSVSTKYPVIKPGQYPWLVKESTVGPIKKDPTKKMLTLKLELQGDAIDNRAENPQPIPPGYVLSHNVTLDPSEKRTKDMIVRDLCSIIDAAWGEEYRKTQLGSLANFDTDSLVGQLVVAKTGVQAEDQEFPERATIARFIAKAA